ncbi:superoxide dismutase [Cu-Zn] SodC [Hahella sp. NBU794]|uniref:superoxide dismutase [Cu-Zn] SodC n=1 Tax=Hahella sp. NBU794 TaxID=3422590 RepID=UPI003D6F8F94
MHKLAITAAAATLALSGALSVQAQDATRVSINKISEEGVGDKIGSIILEPTPNGVLIRPILEGLEPGMHGFHLHEKGSCEAAEKSGEMTAGAAAGGHYDPDKEGGHTGPFRPGHQGDLPALFVDEDGNANQQVLAPKLKVEDMRGHALIIHEGGDNYSDKPDLGGGGARIACGVVIDEDFQSQSAVQQKKQQKLQQKDDSAS